MHHLPARRLGALTTTVALTTALMTSTLLTGAPAQAAPSPSADRAATWLAGELVDGLMPDGYGGSDVGLSLDAALLALAADDAATASTVRSAVAPKVLDYVTGSAYDAPGDVYANEMAKVLTVDVASGGDPRDLGGVDVLARLEALTDPAGMIVSQGDATPANVVGQSFAVEGLAGAGSPLANTARDHLAGLQCPDGSFSLTMPAEGPPSCGDGAASTDATAFALHALSTAPQPPEDVLTRAASWLASVEQPDGSFGSDALISTPNSNSTGLVAAALGNACQISAADRAADWVRGVQLQSGADAGAVAYDEASAAEAEANGIDEVLRDQFRRATAQAGTGLVWDGDATSDLVLTTSPGRLVITGAADGERVCLITPSGIQRLTGTGGPLEVPVAVPTTGSASYAATSGPGRTTLTIAAASAAASPTAPITTPLAVPTTRPRVRFGTARLVRGERHQVRLEGLREGERVVLELRGRTVDRSRAGVTGRSTLRFRVAAHEGGATLKATTLGSGRVFRTTVRVVG